MAFDISMIRKVYDGLAQRVAETRTLVARPLTLAEKILYAHIDGTPAQLQNVPARGQA